MLDSDVAKLFGYETKQLNRQVNRNIERFPEDYCFRVTPKEYKILRCQNGTLELKQGQYSKYLPFVFTEYGITMLAGLLKSDIAVKMSLRIVEAFITMRKYISDSLLEQKYINKLVIQNTEDIKILQESLTKFEKNIKVNEIYFDGQIYDAYSKIKNIFNTSEKELVIIDAYADKSVLDIIRHMKVKIILIVKSKSLLTKIDIEKYNIQYNNLTIIYNDSFHDRYFIIDKDIIYHCGASINHAGSKTFSINKLDDDIIKNSLIEKTKNIINKKE